MARNMLAYGRKTAVLPRSQIKQWNQP